MAGRFWVSWTSSSNRSISFLPLKRGAAAVDGGVVGAIFSPAVADGGGTFRAPGRNRPFDTCPIDHQPAFFESPAQALPAEPPAGSRGYPPRRRRRLAAATALVSFSLTRALLLCPPPPKQKPTRGELLLSSRDLSPLLSSRTPRRQQPSLGPSQAKGERGGERGPAVPWAGRVARERERGRGRARAERERSSAPSPSLSHERTRANPSLSPLLLACSQAKEGRGVSAERPPPNAARTGPRAPCSRLQRGPPSRLLSSSPSPSRLQSPHRLSDPNNPHNSFSLVFFQSPKQPPSPSHSQTSKRNQRCHHLSTTTATPVVCRFAEGRFFSCGNVAAAPSRPAAVPPSPSLVLLPPSFTAFPLGLRALCER
jgi:hypothetical protein